MTTHHSPLQSLHEAAGASFTDFGGWEMPVEYDGVRSEHTAVREQVGRFDVSHMGQVTVSGPDAGALLGRVLASDVSTLAPGDGRYSALLNDSGSLIDDVIVYRWPDPAAGRQYLVVPNVGNDEQIAERIRSYRDQWALTAEVAVVTEEYAMVAIQGPDAPAAVQTAVTDDPTTLSPFEGQWTTLAGQEVFVSRTGYTGEDGFELLGPAEAAPTLWQQFEAVKPCGLGARDTLRIEAGFLLSGQDFDPDDRPVTPVEAGIDFIIDREHEFIGRDQCLSQLASGPDRQFVGLKLTDRGIPRHGYHIVTEAGDRVGTVTSGTMSPTFEVPLGLGYVESAYAEPGTEVAVVIRETQKDATITSHRFLDHL